MLPYIFLKDKRLLKQETKSNTVITPRSSLQFPEPTLLLVCLQCTILTGRHKGNQGACPEVTAYVETHLGI